ncbi:MAG: VacJ family lipoprotein [Alphaproteobacteria bacterium]|nr:VacJ family lipoprotein [Alphaproteobacteria bacterium]
MKMILTKKYKSLITLLFVIGCASTKEQPDPHKDFNEAMLKLNLKLDEHAIRPIAEGYKKATVSPMQKGVSNFLSNLNEPFYAINYVLTTNGLKLFNSIFRFVINTTLGIGGIFDVASSMGIRKSETSHKDTWKKWRVPTGDYLVLPIFGTSSTRDAVTEPVSWFMNPLTYVISWPLSVTKAVVQVINDRAENGKMIDDTLQNSPDIYSTLRSLYMQKYGNETTDAVDESLLDELSE